MHAYIDTDVIIRLLTGDDKKKQEASAVLFEKVSQGALTIAAPDTVIADAIFVLSSPRLYALPRVSIRELLRTLLILPHFKVDNKQSVLQALDIYAHTTLDFGDAFLIAMAQQSKAKILYSFDHDFDDVEGIIRKEP